MSILRRAMIPVASIGAATLAACYDPGLSSSLAPRQEHGAISYVLEEDQLQETANSTLLGSIQARISGMSVRHAGSECPQITLRGPKEIAHHSDPGVYVDGTRAANTCVLEMLNQGDVQRVEVYPMGVTQRPGYEAQSDGLILVFLRDR